MKIIFYESKIYLIFRKNSAGYQDKSSVSQIWYQCQVYENCQQILKFKKTYCIYNIDRHARICNMCNNNDIEDEYHFILECSKYVEIRRKYIKPY